MIDLKIGDSSKPIHGLTEPRERPFKYDTINYINNGNSI